MTVTGGFDALVGGSFLFASSVFPQDKRIDVEDRGEDCYHDKQEENAKREARIGIEVRVQQDYRTGHESGKVSSHAFLNCRAWSRHRLFEAEPTVQY